MRRCLLIIVTIAWINVLAPCHAAPYFVCGGSVSAPADKAVVHTGGGSSCSVTVSTTNHYVGLVGGSDRYDYTVQYNMAAERGSAVVDSDQSVVTFTAAGTWTRYAHGTGTLSGQDTVTVGKRIARAYCSIVDGGYTGIPSLAQTVDSHEFTVVNP